MPNLLIRSLHFAPANDARKASRMRSLDCDVAVLDLEDAVAADEKPAARAAAASALAEASRRPVAAVRVNGLETAWFEADLEGVAVPGLALLVLPKVERLDDVLAIDERLTRLEHERGLDTIGVIAQIETGRGLAAVEHIAADPPARLLRLSFGAVDFRADTGVDPSEDEPELLFARSRIVAAAAMLGRGPALDGPYLSLGDDEGLRRDSARSRRIGFGGRVTIHPAQIDAVNQAYGRLDERTATRLDEIVSAFDEALASGVASIRVGDTFVDYPVYTDAKARLELHRLAGG